MSCLYCFNKSTTSTAIDKQPALVDSILAGGDGVAEQFRAGVQTPWMLCHHNCYGVIPARKESIHVAWSWFISSQFPETRSARHMPCLYAFFGCTVPTAIDKHPALVDSILKGGDYVAEQSMDDEVQSLQIPEAVSDSHDGPVLDNVSLDATTGYMLHRGWM
ncbi:hypothetical protein HPB50_013584 [Hyalomma asiaticum]|uniref:Uncharacterized protein n=1 Tax=Hyalomma asiaticum TaxID=266040 RepID=A0ACB7T7U3_HYAAI|nr:hypothetical protein HPB50_013584 [Hyalomma asiaticum]